MNYNTTGHILWPYDDPRDQARTCDYCGVETFAKLEQTEESMWACPKCVDKMTCDGCGHITEETSMVRIQCAELYDLMDLCPDCIDKL